MNLPARDAHSARLAAVLAGQLLELHAERDERRMSECMYQAGVLTVMGLAHDLGITGFLLSLLEDRDGRYDA